MKSLLLGLAISMTACMGGTTDPGGSGDDGMTTPDAPTGQQANCPLPGTMADLGALPALKAQRCNVSGSMGARKWYRLSATMASGDIVQIELWPYHGAFTGAVTTRSEEHTSELQSR